MRTVMITVSGSFQRPIVTMQLHRDLAAIRREGNCNLVVDASEATGVSGTALFIVKQACEDIGKQGGLFAVIPSRELHRLLTQVGLERELCAVRPNTLPIGYRGKAPSSRCPPVAKARWCVDRVRSCKHACWLSKTLKALNRKSPSAKGTNAATAEISARIH